MTKKSRIAFLEAIVSDLQDALINAERRLDMLEDILGFQNKKPDALELILQGEEPKTGWES